MKELNAKAKGSLIGVAVGDALGATLEFMTREEILGKYGIHKEMIGGGYWQLPPGEVTDDTDMTIAVAKGILMDREDPLDAIAQYFVEWAKAEPKDIGKICHLVLTEGIRRGTVTENEWREVAEAAHQLSGGRSAGNGSLMRTIPIVLGYLTDQEKMLQIGRRQSALTHFDPRAGECVVFYCELVGKILQGQDLKKMLKDHLKKAPVPMRIDLKAAEIKSTGYVVHTLEAALNCAYQTASFEEALIMAVNLGGDTDTIGAVTGGIVGAYYGLEKIPARWLEKLAVRDLLSDLAERLIRR